MWSRVALATALMDHILWHTRKPLESEWVGPKTKEALSDRVLPTPRSVGPAPLPYLPTAVLWSRPLRFCLRDMVLVNKQALRLVPLTGGCEGAGPSSRRGASALIQKERGVCVW